MAENKKGFLMYADWQAIISELSDEEAGQLTKFLFDYVNDKNPVLENRMLSILAKPMIIQLKRDLVKWNESKEEKSISGRAGNIKRWHPDLYKKFISKSLSLEEAEEIAKHRLAMGSDENNRTATKSIANIAVNVNDNVSVNDSVINNTTNVVAFANANASQNHRQEYEALAKECEGKEVNEVFKALKTFIEESRPMITEPYVDVWNIFAPKYGLASIKLITDQRRQKIKTRAREPGFEFFKVLECIRRFSDYRGDANSGWKVDFDFIIENQKNYTKMIERLG